MKIVTRIADLDHPLSLTTGLVPTMGAFHEGHLELMRAARRENDRVVVSLFVNPTQFGKGEDFSRYPRDLERDAQLAESVGVDEIFVPTVEEIYPREPSTVHVPQVTDLWEGRIRPTHFDGVATVVAKLFNIVRPTVAYFGLKDLQQCLVISRMVQDLNLPLRLSLQPTVREPDGLAMSSRNAYLTSEERKVAPLIFEQLANCKRFLGAESLTRDTMDSILAEARSALESNGFVVDYLDLIELESARPNRDLSMPSAVIVAVRLGNTRLIDNILM